MENNIKINPHDVEDLATAYGLLTRCIEKGNFLASDSKEVQKQVSILYVTTFLLSKSLPQAEWSAAVTCCMELLHKRKLSLSSGKEIILPPWDPDDSEHLDCYPICDAFFNLYAWNQACTSSFPPEDYFGPLFSVAGYVLDGVGRGYHATDSTMKELEGNYLDRVYQQLGHPEQGPLMLQKQLEALRDMMLGYWSNRA